MLPPKQPLGDRFQGSVTRHQPADFPRRQLPDRGEPAETWTPPRTLARSGPATQRHRFQTTRALVATDISVARADVAPRSIPPLDHPVLLARHVPDEAQDAWRRRNPRAAEPAAFRGRP